MKKLLVCGAIASTLAMAPGISLAGGVGMNISGAMAESPARLGFSPSMTSVADVGVNIPGSAQVLSVYNEWYDPDTNTLDIRLDFSTQAKAEETVQTLDDLLNGLAGIRPRVEAGISIGRLGLGIVARGETDVTSNSTVDMTADPISGSIDLSAKALGRVDAVASLGIPIGKWLSLGVAGKMAVMGSVNAALQADSSEFTDGASTSVAPTGSYEYGLGPLVDVGLMLNFPAIQADLVMKDVGKLTLEEPVALAEGGTAGPSMLHSDVSHLAGGVTLKPSKLLNVGAYYDKTISGADELRLSAELHPIKLITLRGGYVTDLALAPGLFTAGLGLNLGFMGVDVGANFRSDTVTGASARFRIGF